MLSAATLRQHLLQWGLCDAKEKLSKEVLEERWNVFAVQAKTAQDSAAALGVQPDYRLAARLTLTQERSRIGAAGTASLFSGSAGAGRPGGAGTKDDVWEALRGDISRRQVKRERSE